MRLDQLTLRAAGGALLLLSLVVVVASPGGVVDDPVEQLLRGDLAWAVRAPAALAGVLVVLSTPALGRALDPGRHRRGVPILLGVLGVGLLVLAVTTAAAPTDGDTATEQSVTAGQAVNALAVLVVSTVLPAAMIVQAARWRRDEATAPRAKVAFGAAVVSLWASLAYSLAQQGTVPAAGLWQRIALVVGWAWLAVVLLRSADRLTSGSGGTRT